MVSRRSMLKGAGAFGMVAAAASAQENALADADDASRVPRSDELLAQLESHESKISSRQMTVGIDVRRGVLTSLVRNSDALRLNYLASLRNTPVRLNAESTWTGDLQVTAWVLEREWNLDDTAPNVPFHFSGRWRAESTARSNDIRKVRVSGNSIQVEYRGASSAEGGLKSVDLHSSYSFDKDGALVWQFTLKNTTTAMLEIGELAVPMCVNNDYTEFSNIDPKEVLPNSTMDEYSARTIIQQSLIHEQKVFSHHFVAGHSSYSLIQRPLGDSPFLLLHTLEDTPFECIYVESEETHQRSSPDLLAIYSRATKDKRGWSHNQWVNGHTSLVLEPGKEKTFKLRLTFISSYDQIRAELANAGNLGIRIVPAMVLQEDQPALVVLESNARLNAIELRSDNITMKREEVSGKTHLSLSFKGRGMKSIRVRYGDDRWTNLHFYCTEAFDHLLKARADFIVTREFYLNEKDPFHRYHMFLPFDYRKGSIILESDEAWEVGGSDEPGFSAPVFLAEKNVYYPNRKEVEALESYVSDCLFKYIQNPDDYTVRASLFWVERKPSSPWGEWSEKRSEATWRTYNYVHPANIYHALYRIGMRYGLLTHREPLEYLKMSYRSCMKWFETGPWKNIGLMEGSNALNILADLKREGLSEEHSNLAQTIATCNHVFLAQPYPYSSELLIDQTAHEQVYFFTKFFNDHEKNAKTVQVLKALRGGNQPMWFLYGNDKRRNICCWYSASLNGLALMRSFEGSSDQDALARGFGGVASVMSNVTHDGMGFNYFDCTAGVLDRQPPITWEGGCGLWGFLQATKAIVLRDPDLGLVGYGCAVTESDGALTIRPNDGLRKRIFISEQKLSIEVEASEIDSCQVDRDKKKIVLSLSDSTGLVKKVGLRVAGLAQGEYRMGSERKTIETGGELYLESKFLKAVELTIVRI